MARLLHGVLTLHDLRDAEFLCRRIISRSRFTPQSSDHEELLTYLIEECWTLSLRYEPGGIRFSTYATNTLRRRVVDWQRQRTAGHAGRSGTAGSTNGSDLSSSASTIPATVDWTKLSHEAAWTTVNIMADELLDSDLDSS
jgi:hypothetical protein